MKATKTILALALTLCLLAAGAMLPQIVGHAQNMAISQPGFGEIQTVELTLKEPLSLLEKLSMYADSQTYPYSETTVQSLDTIQELVMAGLGSYYYRELVPYNWKTVSFSASPYLLYDRDAPEVNYIIWIAVLEGKNWRLDMYVDDETGKILSLHYNSMEEQNAYTAKGYTEEFMNAYFESLGLSAEDWHSVSMGTNGNTTSIRCTYQGKEPVSLTLEFTTYPNGFWLYYL